ncbi:MAG: hypothetical protein ABSG06_00170 [Methanoregula sp.]|jgi:hypothetical protein
MKCVLELIGWNEANVSALIILLIVCLAVMAIILVSVTVYESVSNPPIAQETNQVCSFVPDNSSQVQDGISDPMANVTGG